MHQNQRRTNPSARKARGHVAIKEQTRRREHSNSRTRRRAKKGRGLGLEETMYFGNESIGKQGNVGNCSQRIQIFEGNGIGTIVENDGVAMLDEERTGCNKIARLDIRKRIVEEIIRVTPHGGVRLKGPEGFLVEEINGQGEPLLPSPHLQEHPTL
jgi:hypothetical protein